MVAAPTGTHLWRFCLVLAAIGLTNLLAPQVLTAQPDETQSEEKTDAAPSDAEEAKTGDDAAENDSTEKTGEDGEDSAEESKEEDGGFQGQIKKAGEKVVGALESVLFFGIPTGVEGKSVPLVLLVLVLGGVFFTIRFGFVNVRLFRHSIDVIRGKYDQPGDEGEITHFQALTSALSATVGLGNIAGVAVAIATGGPGAVFWMWCIAFFGMTSKFVSCSYAQYYRRVSKDGTVLGGPMVYLEEGIKERFPSLAPLGKIFGVMFAIFTMFAAFGGGNMFQGNQTFKIVSGQFNVPPNMAWLCGIIMAILVGLVIIGGIRRIGEVTSKLVPAMCVFYVICCTIIILTRAGDVPAMFASIFQSAFQPEAMFGGMVGVLIIGAQRAAFSNEAGIGSAAIAHAAARTKEPVREGVVAMIGPFIDTIVICTMTALTLLITKSHIDPATGQPFVEEVAKEKDIAMTAAAFETLGSWVPYLLCVAVCVFAYSTMISWSYYGEKAAEYLFGPKGVKPYRIIFVIFVVLGPILSLKVVIGFSDMMLFSMAFPNIIGLILISGLLAREAKKYIERLKSGQMKPVK